MQNYYTPKSKHLTLTERRMIERWLQEGLSNREIARRLDVYKRQVQNVSRIFYFTHAYEHLFFIWMASDNF